MRAGIVKSCRKFRPRIKTFQFVFRTGSPILYPSTPASLVYELKLRTVEAIRLRTGGYFTIFCVDGAFVSLFISSLFDVVSSSAFL